MNFIKKNKKTWKLLASVDIILSGYAGVGIGPRYRYKNNDLDEVDNIIFMADIKPVGMSKGQSSALTMFEDKDGLHKYEASTNAMYHIAIAVARKDIEARGGYLRGIWTFRKMGTTVSIWPCDALGVEYKDRR